MVAAALQALKCLVGRTTREISALGLAGTWHSLLLLDGDGRPLGPISLWSDLSAAPSVAQLRKDRGLVQACYQKTGCVVHATYPVYKYYHLAAQVRKRSNRRAMSLHRWSTSTKPSPGNGPCPAAPLREQAFSTFTPWIGMGSCWTWPACTGISWASCGKCFIGAG